MRCSKKFLETWHLIRSLFHRRDAAVAENYLSLREGLKASGGGAGRWSLSHPRVAKAQGVLLVSVGA